MLRISYKFPSGRFSNGVGKVSVRDIFVSHGTVSVTAGLICSSGFNHARHTQSVRGPDMEIFHRRPAIKARYGGISDATLYRWIKVGRFPQPVKLGPNVVAWRESVLREYDADPEGWAEKSSTGGEQ
jgi:predicted DNA-binding transcriptional regulator AlpA